MLVAIGAALWAVPATREAAVGRTGSTHLPWWLLAVVAGLCEIVVLHIQVQRESHGISLSELATVLGLFFTSSAGFVVGREVGTLAVFILWRRQSGTKVIFNAALTLAESTLALLVFHAAQGDSGLSARAWGAAIAATAAAAVLASIAVTSVIALAADERRGRDFLLEPARGVLTAIFVSVIGLVAVYALAFSPWAGGPLALAMFLLLLAYRAYSRLSERQLSLERLYRFSHAVTSTPEVDQILTEVLARAREVLHAEYAEVVFVSSDQGHQPLRIDTGGADGKLRRTRLSDLETGQDVWAGVVAGGPPVLLTRADRDARQFLDERDFRDAVLAPLRTDSGIVGTILVGDRMSDVRTFDDNDVQLLTAVANHASMALQAGQLVDRLRHDALHDKLTGLPNRSMLNQDMVEALGDVRAGRSPGLTLVMMDLVGFKQVNDTFGYHLGDLLLQEVGERMSEALLGRGVLARLGGDEFAALLPRMDSVAQALDVAARVRAALERPIGIEGVDVEVGVSIGIAVAPAHGLDGHTLMKRADAAMYEAKSSGNGLHVHQVGQEPVDTPERLALTAELRAGISGGQLEVYVQPQASLRTGKVLGVEALVRWRHPRHGLLYPDTFIPLAERSGLIRQLTDEVLEQAVAAAGRWRREGYRLTTSVNLSARGNLNHDLVRQVELLLHRHGVPPQALNLEITESAVISDPARTAEVLDELNALGVGLSLDDFGTGYSSMSHLRQLPVREVKVDKSFVMAMMTSPEDATIVRSVIDLGTNLGLDVVAEGVEDLQTWQELDRLGCQIMQGFYLAAPMPLSDFTEWLAAREGRLIPAERSH